MMLLKRFRVGVVLVLGWLMRMEYKWVKSVKGCEGFMEDMVYVLDMGFWGDVV